MTANNCRSLIDGSSIKAVLCNAKSAAECGQILWELRLPETLPLSKLSPRMQQWIVVEAGALQRDVMTHPTAAVLVRNGLPLTRENYLNLNNVDEDDLDPEQETELPQLFQQSMIEERVASVMLEIDIDDTLRQMSEGNEHIGLEPGALR